MVRFVSRQQTFGSVREFRISELLDQVFSPPRELLFLWGPLINLLQYMFFLSLSLSLSPRAIPPFSSSVSAVSRPPFSYTRTYTHTHTHTHTCIRPPFHMRQHC